MIPCVRADSRGSSGSAATGESDSRAVGKGPKVHSSFRINPVVQMFSQMRGEKEKIIKQIGLHGMTKLPKEEPMSNRAFNLQFAFWLLQKLNKEDGSLDLGFRGSLPIGCEDVGLVLSIPCSGEELKRSDPLALQQTKQLTKNQLLLEPKDELNLMNVKKVLERDLREDSSDAEKRAFVTASFIFAVSYFLAPKGRKAKVNNEILECLLKKQNPETINWASYVLLSLREASAKVQNEISANTKSVTLDGCLLLLQVVYLDNLDFGLSSTIHEAVPRVQEFTFEVLDSLIGKDKNKKCGSTINEYGVTKLRGDQNTSYSRGDLYRAILLSKDRRDKEQYTYYLQIIKYLRKNVEDAKKKIRLASAQFEKQACESMEETHNNLVSLFEIWLTSADEVQIHEGSLGADSCSKGQPGGESDLGQTEQCVRLGGCFKISAIGEAGTSHTNRKNKHSEMTNSGAFLESEKSTRIRRKILAHKKKKVGHVQLGGIDTCLEDGELERIM